MMRDQRLVPRKERGKAIRICIEIEVTENKIRSTLTRLDDDKKACCEACLVFDFISLISNDFLVTFN